MWMDKFRFAPDGMGGMSTRILPLSLSQLVLLEVPCPAVAVSLNSYIGKPISHFCMCR